MSLQKIISVKAMTLYIISALALFFSLFGNKYIYANVEKLDLDEVGLREGVKLADNQDLLAHFNKIFTDKKQNYVYDYMISKYLLYDDYKRLNKNNLYAWRLGRVTYVVTSFYDGNYRGMVYFRDIDTKLGKMIFYLNISLFIIFLICILLILRN